MPAEKLRRYACIFGLLALIWIALMCALIYPLPSESKMPVVVTFLASINTSVAGSLFWFSRLAAPERESVNPVRAANPTL